MKQSLLAVGLGLLTLAAVFGAMFAISNDMRLVFAIGVVLLAGSGALLAARGARWPIALLLAAPLVIAFWVLAVPQLPRLWPHPVFWLVAAFAGFALGRRDTGRRAASGCALTLAVVALWYGWRYVPEATAASLTSHKAHPAPQVALADLDGHALVSDWKGKVVVLDFFATWCVPCKAELPELAKVRAALAPRGDFEMWVVDNDTGGDTPERARAFAMTSPAGLSFAYDAGGKAHAAFGFSGLPALVLIDRAGNVRMTHEGYNAAETSFAADLQQQVQQLLDKTAP